VCTSTRTNASTAARASRCARSRRSTTRTTSPRPGSRTWPTTRRSSPRLCRGGTPRSTPLAALPSWVPWARTLPWWLAGPYKPAAKKADHDGEALSAEPRGAQPAAGGAAAAEGGADTAEHREDCPPARRAPEHRPVPPGQPGRQRPGRAGRAGPPPAGPPCAVVPPGPADEPGRPSALPVARRDPGAERRDRPGAERAGHPRRP